MTIVAFDEAHGETWTISRKLAAEASPSKPEYVFYGHLADVLRLDPQCKVVRLTQPWTDETLRGIQVLIIAHPANPQHEGLICSGSPTFSEHDQRILREFVGRGGGLFVINEHDAERWGHNLNEVLAPFDLQCADDTIAAPKDALDAYLLVQHFTCKDLQKHSTTEGLSRISYHRGCSIKCMGSAKGLIRAPSGQIVFAISEFESGRIAAIGDSDLFSIPYVGGFDNLLLFQNTIQWLSKIAKSPEKKLGLQLLEKEVFDISGIEHNRDLTLVEGGHAIDLANSDIVPIAHSLANLINPYERPEEFLDEAELCFQQLPRHIRSAVSKFRRHGNEYGCLLLRNLPIDLVLPDTPANSRRSPEKKTFVTESVLGIFSRGLGEPFAYRQEKDGELFQNICPTKVNLEKLSSESATILLDFHTETAFHPYMPDFVMLLCLRSDHEKRARTEAASTRQIIPLLPLKYRSLLFQPLYRTGIDYSFGSLSGVQGNGPLLPVFYGGAYDPFMKYDLDLMKGESHEAAEALLQMKTATNAAKNFVRLVPGDLMIVDNRRSVHSRSEFTPRFDGKDRWLQRCYVLRDLAASEELRMTRDRLIAIEFQV